MTFDEIRLVKVLVETAREIAQIEPGWANDNLAAFEMVMRRNQPSIAREMTEQQITRCLRAAFAEFNICKTK